MATPALTRSPGPLPPRPCYVCGSTHDTKSEPRFGYVYCPTHADVPPAYLDEGKRQFEEHGSTQWDVK